jgi:cell division protein FtsA
MYNTVLGLLAKGDINCAGNVIDPNRNLFDNQDDDGPVLPGRKARQLHETQTGTIRTLQEEEEAAAEARRKKEAEEKAAEEEKRRIEAEELQRKKDGRWWNKMRRNVGKLIDDITKEE